MTIITGKTIPELDLITDHNDVSYIPVFSTALNKMARISKANLIDSFVHIRILKADLPTELADGQALGVVMVTDIDDGTLGYMNDLALWKNLDTGDALLSDPFPLVYYTDTSPIAYGASLSGTTLPEFAFDTSLPLTGTHDNRSYINPNGPTTEQRFVYELSSIKNVFKIRYSNYHSFGASVSNGMNDIKIYTSVEASDNNLTYNSITVSMNEIFDGALDIHTAVDEADFKTLALTSTGGLAKYIIFDVATSHGGSITGVRRFEIG